MIPIPVANPCYRGAYLVNTASPAASAKARTTKGDSGRNQLPLGACLAKCCTSGDGGEDGWQAQKCECFMVVQYFEAESEIRFFWNPSS